MQAPLNASTAFTRAHGLALFLLLILFVPIAQAQTTINVNSTADVLSDDGECTLREAILNANSDSDTTDGDCPAGTGKDTIVLPAGRFVLEIGGIFEDGGSFGDLDIWDSVIIQGQSTAATVIDADSLDRVFHILGFGATKSAEVLEVTLQNLSIVQGYLTSDFDIAAAPKSAGYPILDGAGILNDGGDLTLTNVTVEKNYIHIDEEEFECGPGTGNGAGIANIDYYLGPKGASSKVSDDPEPGKLTMTNVTVMDNHITVDLPADPPGAAGKSSCAFGAPGHGGGLYNQGGYVSATGSFFDSNTTFGPGGGIANVNPDDFDPCDGAAGSKQSCSDDPEGATLILDQVTVSNNTSGLFDEEELLDIFDGPEALFFAFYSSGGGLYNEGGAVEMSNSFVEDNATGDNVFSSAGAGIASFPGDIEFFIPFEAAPKTSDDPDYGGTLYFDNVEITDNVTGEGLFSSGSGGGVFSVCTDVYAEYLTVSRNGTGTGGFVSGSGGGFMNLGGLFENYGSDINSNWTGNAIGADEFEDSPFEDFAVAGFGGGVFNSFVPDDCYSETDGLGVVDAYEMSITNNMTGQATALGGLGGGVYNGVSLQWHPFFYLLFICGFPENASKAACSAAPAMNQRFASLDTRWEDVKANLESAGKGTSNPPFYIMFTGEDIEISGNTTGRGTGGDDGAAEYGVGGFGGGLANEMGIFYVDDVTVSDNETGRGSDGGVGGFGGGIFNGIGPFPIFIGGDISVIDVEEMTLSGNVTGGGGIQNGVAGLAGAGGGLAQALTEAEFFILDANASKKATWFDEVREVVEETRGTSKSACVDCEDMLTWMLNSSVTNNTTGEGLGLEENYGGAGGGLFASNGEMQLGNTTVSSNTTGDGMVGGPGGGIFVGPYLLGYDDYYDIELNNVTITDNETGNGDYELTGGGGISSFYNVGEQAAKSQGGPPVAVSNTIIAGNRVSSGQSGTDCLGHVYSLGYNLVGDASDCFGFDDPPLAGSKAAYDGDLIGDSDNPIDALLGPLTPDGYHPLLANSPAIDAGNPFIVTHSSAKDDPGYCIPFDQIDTVRPIDGDEDGDPVCDIGAIESGSFPADLSLDKVLNESTNNGDGTITSVYTITLSNAGPANATGIEVDELPDAAMTIIDTDASLGFFDGGSNTWHIDELPVGESATLEVTTTYSEDDAGAGNFAEVSAVQQSDPDSTPGDGSGDDASGTSGSSSGDREIDLSRFHADVRLTKEVDNAAPAAGENIVYTLTVYNHGPSHTAGIRVKDLLPTGVSFASASFSDASDSYDANSGMWEVGNVPRGKTATLEIMVTVTGSGEIVNTAEVYAHNLPDPNSTPNNGRTDENDYDEATINVQSGIDALAMPTEVELGNNYPNPFNPVTVIPYALPEASKVSIRVYDLLGRVVQTLVDGTIEAGRHEVAFRAERLPTGVYLVRLEAADLTITRRITLMK